MGTEGFMNLIDYLANSIIENETKGKSQILTIVSPIPGKNFLLIAY